MPTPDPDDFPIAPAGAPPLVQRPAELEPAPLPSHLTHPALYQPAGETAPDNLPAPGAPPA